MPRLFHADECIDARIIDGVRRESVDIVTAADEGLLGAADEAHVARANASDRIIITCDYDFLHPAVTTQLKTGLVFIRPHVRVGDAVRRIVALASLDPLEVIFGIEWI